MARAFENNLRMKTTGTIATETSGLVAEPQSFQPAGRAGRNAGVQVRSGTVALPTYLPAAPDKNPMFLERRVYQGSSGKVYPLPFTDRIAEKPVIRNWRAVWLENEFLRVLVLPEIGGRIHAVQGQTHG